MLMHSSGQWMRSNVSVRAAKPDAQGLGSAITYLRRYSLCAMVGIAPGDDDDGNAASADQGSVKSNRPAPPKKPVEKPALKPTDVVIAEGFWDGASYKVTAGTAADFATTLIAYTQAGSKAGGLSALDKLWDDNKAFIDRIREAAPDEYTRYMTELNGVRGVLLTQSDADQLEAAE